MAIGGISTDMPSAKCQEQAVTSSSQKKYAFGKSVKKRPAKPDVALRDKNNHGVMKINHRKVFPQELLVLQDDDQLWNAKPLQLVKKGGKKSEEEQKKFAKICKQMDEHKRRLYKLDLCIQGNQVKLKELMGDSCKSSISDINEASGEEFIFQVKKLNIYVREAIECYLEKEYLDLVAVDSLREIYSRFGERYEKSCSKHVKVIGEFFNELIDINNQLIQYLIKFKSDCKVYLFLRKDKHLDSDHSLKQKCINISIALSALSVNHYYNEAINAPINEFVRKAAFEPDCFSSNRSAYLKSVALLIKFTGLITVFFPRCEGKELCQHLKGIFDQIIGPLEKRALNYYGSLIHARFRRNANKTKEIYTDDWVKRSMQDPSWDFPFLTWDEAFRIVSIRSNMDEYLTCSLCFLLGDRPILALNNIRGVKEYFQNILTGLSEEEEKEKLIVMIQTYIDFDSFYGLCQMFLFKLAGYHYKEYKQEQYQQDVLPDADVMVYSALALELEKFTNLFVYRYPEFPGKAQEAVDELTVFTKSPQFNAAKNRIEAGCRYFYESLVCFESMVEEIKWLSIIDSLKDSQYLSDHCNRMELADTAFHQLMKEAEEEKPKADKKQGKKAEANRSHIAGRVLSHYSQQPAKTEPVVNIAQKPLKSCRKGDHCPRGGVKGPEFHPGLIDALSEFGNKTFSELEKQLELVELDNTVCGNAAAKYARVDWLLTEAVKEIERLGCKETGTKLNSYQKALYNGYINYQQDKILTHCMDRVNTTQKVLKNTIGKIDFELEKYREYIQKHRADLQVDFWCIDFFREKLRVIHDGLGQVEGLGAMCKELYKQRGKYIRQRVDPSKLQSHVTSRIGCQMKRALLEIKNSEIITECGQKVDSMRARVDGMVKEKKDLGHQRKQEPLIQKVIHQIDRQEKKQKTIFLSVIDKLRANFDTLVENHSRSGCFLPIDVVDALSDFGKQCRQEAFHPKLARLENSWAVESLFNNYVSQFIAQGRGRYQPLPDCYVQTDWLERYNKKELFIPPEILMETSESGTGADIESDHFDQDMKLLSDALDIPVRIKFPSGCEREYLPNFVEFVEEGANGHVSRNKFNSISLVYDHGQICSVNLSNPSLQEGRDFDRKGNEGAKLPVPELSKVKTITDSPIDSQRTVASTLEVLTLKQFAKTNKIYKQNRALVIHGSFSRYLQGQQCVYNDIDIMSVSAEAANLFMDMMLAEFCAAKNNEKNHLSGVHAKDHRTDNACVQLNLPKLWGVNFYDSDERKEPLFRVQLTIYDKIAGLDSLIRINYPLDGDTSQELPCLPVHLELLRMNEVVKNFSERYLVNHHFIPEFDIPRTIIFSQSFETSYGGNKGRGTPPEKDVIVDQNKSRCCALIMRAIMTYVSGNKLFGQICKPGMLNVSETDREEQGKLDDSLDSLQNCLNTLKDRILSHKNYRLFRKEVEQWQKQRSKQYQNDYVTHLISQLE